MQHAIGTCEDENGVFGIRATQQDAPGMDRFLKMLTE
jgi:hypothetical protein